MCKSNDYLSILNIYVPVGYYYRMHYQVIYQLMRNTNCVVVAFSNFNQQILPVGNYCRMHIKITNN